MKARFQVQTKGRNSPPYMQMEFDEDVQLPERVFISGDVRTNGMTLTAFKRPETHMAEVKKRDTKPWSKKVTLPWEFIGGYMSWERIVPTNYVEIPVLPNDPVRPERWMIEPLMGKKKTTPPAVRTLSLNPEKALISGAEVQVVAPNTLPQDAPPTTPAAPPANTVPVFVRLRDAVRALNAVLAELPEEPTIEVQGRKIRVSIPLE